MISKKRHEILHTKTERKLYKCQYCERRFRHVSSKKKHEIMQTNTDKKPHKCQYCNKGFSQSGSRNQHEMIHTGINEPHNVSTVRSV